MGCSSGKLKEDNVKNYKKNIQNESKTVVINQKNISKEIEENNKENIPKDERNFDLKLNNEEISKEGKKVDWIYTHQK